MSNMVLSEDDKKIIIILIVFVFIAVMGLCLAWYVRREERKNEKERELLKEQVLSIEQSTSDSDPLRMGGAFS